MRSLTHPLQRTPAFFSDKHLPPLDDPTKVLVSSRRQMLLTSNQWEYCQTWSSLTFVALPQLLC
jgi:hypothetical protein